MADQFSLSSLDYSTNFDSIAKVLLIGDTGSGKSTLINYLFNYFHKGELDQLKIGIPCKYHPIQTEQCPHSEVNIDDNTQSKTDSCTQYMFTDATTNRQYLFLDTPGVSDTRGNEQKVMNMTKIIDATTQLGSLTAVVIVVNGSISRLTVCLRSVLASLNGNLPDSVLENVIIVLTNVKKHESPFDLKIFSLHGNVYPFYMQNNAFVSNSSTWTPSIRADLEINWYQSMSQIELILQTIDSLKQLSINGFIQMKQNRNDMRSIVHQVCLELIHIHRIQNQLAQLDLNTRRNHQDPTQTYTIEKIELVDAPCHNTLCINCNEVCHQDCQPNEMKTNNSQISSQCLMMNNGRCQQCRNHCPFTNHYHAKKTIETTQTTLRDVLIELRNKFQQTRVNGYSHQGQTFTRLEMNVLLERALKEKVYRLRIKTMELRGICSAFTLARELKSLMRQLRKEAEQFEDLDTRHHSEQVVQSLGKLLRDIESHQDQYRQERPSMQIIEKKSSENKSIDVKLLHTADLVETHRKSLDRALQSSILEELYRRVQGKSAGPFSTPSEMMMISRYSDKYKSKNVHDLSYEYRKLQKQINDILGSNIFKIIDVDSELLIENFILQTILDEKEKGEITHHERASGFSARSTNHPPSPPVHRPPYPTNDIPLSSTQSSKLHSYPIGFSHILSAPYPSSNESSLLPELPVDYQTSSHSNDQQSQMCYPPLDYRYTSSASQNSIASIDPQIFVTMPTPTTDEQHLFNIDHRQFALSSNKNGEYSDEVPSHDLSPRPDVVPAKNEIFNSPLIQRRDQFASVDHERFRRLNNSKLLLMYTTANAERNETRRVAILEELQRRCYGEYPMLIDTNRKFVQQRLQFNETKPIAELRSAQASIHQQIRIYLKDNDFTLINDIPMGLLIEANVLNQLILSKEKV